MTGAPRRDAWYPVTRSEELVRRHVVHAQLLGQELALWRDDADRPNAWENRCPHRGVRLSIGINDGTELRCRYHGWRFAGVTGRCTFIPAHPTQKPASTIHARVFDVTEIGGYVWVSLGPTPVAPPAPMADRHITTLRSLFVEASSATLSSALERDGHDDPTLVHWLQPVDEARTVLHGAVLDAPPGQNRLTLLRRHHVRMAGIRDAAEAQQRDTP